MPELAPQFAYQPDSRLSPGLAWLDGQSDRMVSLLKDWSGINSYSLNVPGLSLMAGAISDEASRLGWHALSQALPGYPAVDDFGRVALQGLGEALRFSSPVRKGKSVFLVIHYDTVFSAAHAFQTARMEGPNTLVGPGVLDAKGGCLILLYGLAAFEMSGVAEGLNWEVLINPDEEIGSPGSGPVIAQAGKGHDYGLVFEPELAPGVMAGARKGSLNYTLVVRGQAAHAGRDFAKGKNAGVHMAQMVTRLHGINTQVPGVTLNVGPMHVHSPVNIVPDMAMARFNVRFDTDEQHSRVEGEINGIFQWAALEQGFKVEIHPGAFCPAKPVTKESQRLMDMVTDVSAALGKKVEWRATGGVCDGNRLAGAGLATVDTLGAIGGGLHTETEHVELDSLVSKAKVLALTLGRLAEGKDV